MKKKICRLGLFCATFFSILLLLENIFFSRRGILTVWDDIQHGEEAIDVLIMGNSHAYTALDAKCMSEALDKNIYVLGSGSQNMEMTYETLKFVLKHKKPQCIVLEAYCTYVDSKELLQTERIGNMMRYFDGVDNYVNKAELVVNTYQWNRIPEGIFQMMRPTNMWTRWEFARNNMVEADTHGYNALETQAFSNVSVQERERECAKSYEEAVCRELTAYNYESLKKFLKLTEENGIEVWLVNAPNMLSEISSAMKYLEEICAEYSHVTYVDDMHFNMVEMGLEEVDFYDEGHLNRRGAEKFTKFFANLLAQREFGGVIPEWNNAFGYETESVMVTSNGEFCYQMKNYSENCLYRFELRKAGVLIDAQDYSEQNNYTTSIDIGTSEEYELYCAMIPTSQGELGNKSPERIKIPFLKLNDCVIE